MKSHVSDHLELVRCVLKDASARCAAEPSYDRDLITIRSRVKHEGLSFLTITLPTFGKEFERALDQGWIDSSQFRSFRKRGSIPAFLQGMISLVFDIGTGRRLEHVDIQAIEGVRQVAYLFKKLECDCTLERVRAALNNFKSVENDLAETSIGVHDVGAFADVSRFLWDHLANISVDQLVPRHGPGATAESISGNQKYAWQFWYDRLEPYFPLIGTAFPNMGIYNAKPLREFKKVTIVSEEQELPVKVTPVPKTLKGPRIIAIEPVCMQYAQQAIRAELYARLESADMTAGHVNFTDQSVNQRLALKSSADGSMATLDLSDASDRVRNDLAMRMFDCNPELRDAIQACRSRFAMLPEEYSSSSKDRLVGPMKKFASMGSALCFPVESMYFYTICVVALLREQNLPVTRRNCYLVSRDVYVYGDDIIVPSRHAAAVVDNLQKYCCKVNTSKSFWTGKFRESCGCDAYDGVDVTPIYIRQERPTSRRQATKIISWVSSMNAFYKKGYIETSAHLQRACERLLGKMPVVQETSSALGCVRDAPLTTGKWNRKLHRSEVRAWGASPVYQKDRLKGYAALMKFFLMNRGIVDATIPRSLGNHLEESVRRNAVTLKRCWFPVNN